MISVGKGLSPRPLNHYPVGSLRGARLGLAALVALGALGMLAPAASADPLIGVLDYALAAPIILVLFNFPINGLMLLLVYSLRIRTSRSRRPENVMNHFLDFGAVVLLFTLVGAAIDWSAWMSIYEFGDPEVAMIFLAGLAGIGISCYIVCRRYLGMDRGASTFGGVLTTSVNLLLWIVLIAVDTAEFSHVGIPVLIVLWILFEVILVRDSIHIVRATPSEEASGGSVPIAWPKWRHAVAGGPPAPTKDVGRLRVELWIACLVVLCIVIAISIVMSSMDWIYL
jgi:hypothetical protein